MVDIQNLLENSKSNMMNMLQNRKLYLAIFLFFVIILIVFALAYHLNTTLSKQEANNKLMIQSYEEIGGSE